MLWRWIAFYDNPDQYDFSLIAEADNNILSQISSARNLILSNEIDKYQLICQINRYIPVNIINKNIHRPIDGGFILINNYKNYVKTIFPINAYNNIATSNIHIKYGFDELLLNRLLSKCIKYDKIGCKLIFNVPIKYGLNFTEFNKNKTNNLKDISQSISKLRGNNNFDIIYNDKTYKNKFDHSFEQSNLFLSLDSLRKSSIKKLIFTKDHPLHDNIYYLNIIDNFIKSDILN